MQQNILAQLQGDAPAPVDVNPAVVPNLAPVGIVDPLEVKKRVKRPTDAEEPKKKPATPKRKRPASDEAPAPSQDGAVSGEEEEKPKKKRKRPAPQEDDADTVNDDSEKPPNPKKKKSSASRKDDGAKAQVKKSSAPRKQPGYAMIKAEDERLRNALDALHRKRDQRESVSGGKAPTSTCGVLTNNLIDFYENIVDSFFRKFGRYIN
jgi:hypothetical protein